MQKINKNHPIILASNSPQRKRLLEDFAISFTVIPANIVENIHPQWSPEEAVVKLAQQKARDVVERNLNLLQQRKFYAVLSADTVVVLQDKILGKPRDNEEAQQMIRGLSHQKHRVITGVCLYSLENDYVSDHCTTIIELEPMTSQQIDTYIENNNVTERAGGIDIENIGSIRHMEGNFNNVIGLPVEYILEKWFF
ncbi:Maf family protein [Candidatus Uabimicrobium amorphum]|uniref:Nucleoside triphosphate pyrophosphatase n=1 Tax=Uabimicrobium amorphum TaxID=2596890 RepID=A0A5S9IM32_UABAM|nr:Maf family protein [Candidatus Uabimicrobium amorphum]BBM84040.1 septum formation protein Maf [Candidatus Uabimicrobium amorphum]